MSRLPSSALQPAPVREQTLLKRGHDSVGNLIRVVWWINKHVPPVDIGPGELPVHVTSCAFVFEPVVLPRSDALGVKIARPDANVAAELTLRTDVPSGQFSQVSCKSSRP